MILGQGQDWSWVVTLQYYEYPSLTQGTVRGSTHLYPGDKALTWTEHVNRILSGALQSLGLPEDHHTTILFLSLDRDEPQGDLS
jgi:hypothetical protein